MNVYNRRIWIHEIYPFKFEAPLIIIIIIINLRLFTNDQNRNETKVNEEGNYSVSSGA